MVVSRDAKSEVYTLSWHQGSREAAIGAGLQVGSRLLVALRVPGDDDFWGILVYAIQGKTLAGTRYSYTPAIYSKETLTR